MGSFKWDLGRPSLKEGAQFEKTQAVQGSKRGDSAMRGLLTFLKVGPFSAEYEPPKAGDQAGGDKAQEQREFKLQQHCHPPALPPGAR